MSLVSDELGIHDLAAARVFAREGAWPDWYYPPHRIPVHVLEEAQEMRARFTADDPAWRNGTVRAFARPEL